jgi:hypothetical protein
MTSRRADPCLAVPARVTLVRAGGLLCGPPARAPRARPAGSLCGG